MSDRFAASSLEIKLLRAAIREALEYLESDASVTWQQRSANAIFVLNAVMAGDDQQKVTGK